MTHIDQQREVLNPQHNTLNKLLASLVSQAKPNSCLATTRVHETSLEDVGKRENSTAVRTAVEEIDSGSPLPKIVGGAPTTTAKLAGVEVDCLVDTGSMVSLV